MPEIRKLSVGPIVGHVDTNHARLWGRAIHEKLANGAPRRAFGIARIKRQGGSYTAPRFFKMNPNFDMTGIVVFTGLDADTAHAYQMGWFFSDKELGELRSSESWDWRDADQGVFNTASNDPCAEKQFIFGSCRYLLRLFGGSWFDNRGDKTFRSIIRQMENDRGVDKLLMVGDQIYADDLNFLAPDAQVDEYLNRYRDAFGQKYIKQLMSRVSTYMTLDDHEIEDNWPSRASRNDTMVKYPAAIHAYQVYQMSHSPVVPVDDDGKLMGAPEKFYYAFQDGCCDFFVTDTRTERDPENLEMIGGFQMDALLGWLADGAQRIKFVVTSVPFFPDATQENEDKWGGHKHQRDQIIEHIRDHRVQKVVFLAGDVHCSLAAELDVGSEAEPLKIYSVISSSFYWPYPHMKRRQFQLSGKLSTNGVGNGYQLGKVSPVYSGDNFSRVRASPTRLKVEVYERKGGLKHSQEFHF